MKPGVTATKSNEFCGFGCEITYRCGQEFFETDDQVGSQVCDDKANLIGSCDVTCVPCEFIYFFVCSIFFIACFN